MAASRTAVRSMRTLTTRSTLRNTRAYSSVNQSTSPAANGSSAVVGGLIGGGAVLAVGYGYYHFSGAKTAVNTAKQAKAYFNQGAQKLQSATPEPSEALKWLRETSISYAAIIPGAEGYVNNVFDDLDKVHEKHGDKVDAEVKEAYTKLAKVSKEKGLSLEAAQEAGQILEKLVKNLSSLAGDAASDVMNNHPDLKEKVGGNLDQLKSMGEKYGPEAKKQVDKTWEQVQDIVKTGVSAESINKIRKIVQEKTEMLKKMGDEAWQKGMEQAKPFLEKSPKVKELVEQNADALKEGNVGELWEKVKQATKSGKTDDLEKYVKSAAEKVQSKGKEAGLDLSKFFPMVPGADEIMPKIMQLKEVGEKHGKEAEGLLKETFKEIQEVLQKKLGEADKIAKKAKKDSE